MLLARWTYQNFYAVWPNRTDNPFTEVLNRTQKYVASNTLREPLPWQNSTLLKGDAAEAVATLKTERPEGQLVILGSGELIRSLMRRNLVDETSFLSSRSSSVPGTGYLPKAFLRHRSGSLTVKRRAAVS